MWKEKAKDLKFNQKKTWNEITQELKPYFGDKSEIKVYETIRTYIRSTEEYKEINKKTQKINKSSVKMNSDGSFSRELIVEVNKKKDYTVEEILNLHNLSADEWEVTSYTNNYWDSQDKSGKILMFQSKITVKPRNSNKLTFKDIDKHFSNVKYKPLELPYSPVYECADDVLEILVPDLHIGLYSWSEETGEEYNLQVAKDNYFKIFNQILERCQNKKFKKIYFVTLGDFIHVDNNQNTTTKGTFQQVDGRLGKIIEVAQEIFTHSIIELLKIAPVYVVNTLGNHARTQEYMLGLAVKNLFSQTPNVEFDVSPNPQKAVLLQPNVLIGYVHGDMPKKNIADWLNVKVRDIMQPIKFVEIHAGHFHSQYVQSSNGLIVKYFPTITGHSYWEHQQGYQSQRSLMCNIWGKTNGLKETWQINL